jgi:anti-anti-sigma regulatory factor
MLALIVTNEYTEAPMLVVRVENLGDLAVVDCKGSIVNSESVFKLRDVVTAQADARIIALDLCEVDAIGGGGLGMLAFLQRWANDRDIELKLFSPSPSVMNGLERTRSTLDIATFHEMMTILSHTDSRYAHRFPSIPLFGAEG